MRENAERTLGVDQGFEARRPLRIVNSNFRGRARSQPSELVEKALRTLHIGFVALPLVAGVDKFASVLTDWSQFVAPAFSTGLGISAAAVTYGAGAFEILLAAALVFRPRVFADVLGLWIAAITVNLLVGGVFYDIALFNFALAAGACALARLSTARERGGLSRPRVHADPDDYLPIFS